MSFETPPACFLINIHTTHILFFSVQHFGYWEAYPQMCHWLPVVLERFEFVTWWNMAQKGFLHICSIECKPFDICILIGLLLLIIAIGWPIITLDVWMDMVHTEFWRQYWNEHKGYQLLHIGTPLPRSLTLSSFLFL